MIYLLLDHGSPLCYRPTLAEARRMAEKVDRPQGVEIWSVPIRPGRPRAERCAGGSDRRPPTADRRPTRGERGRTPSSLRTTAWKSHSLEEILKKKRLWHPIEGET